MPDGQGMFEPAAPLLEAFARGTIIFLALLALMRVVGQREAGGLGITDVLLVVLVAEGAAVGLHGHAKSITEGLVMITTILFWSVAVDAVAYRWPPLAKVLKARPKPLIMDGQLNRKVMRRELMTDEEIASQLRLQRVEDLAHVERAYIEPNGMISIFRRDGRETEAREPPEHL